MLEDPRDKADEPLRQALDKSRAERIRAIFRLKRPNLRDAKAKPKDFSSRFEYRRALIEERAEQMEEQIGPIISDLGSLGLEVQGGKMGSNIIAIGDGGAILKGLEHEGVTAGLLDQELEVDLGRPKEARPVHIEPQGALLKLTDIHRGKGESLELVFLGLMPGEETLQICLHQDENLEVPPVANLFVYGQGPKQLDSAQFDGTILLDEAVAMEQSVNLYLTILDSKQRRRHLKSLGEIRLELRVSPA